MAETLLENPFPTVTDLMRDRPEERIEGTTLEDAIRAAASDFRGNAAPIACSSVARAGRQLGEDRKRSQAPARPCRDGARYSGRADRDCSSNFSRGSPRDSPSERPGRLRDFGLPYEKSPTRKTHVFRRGTGRTNLHDSPYGDIERDVGNMATRSRMMRSAAMYGRTPRRDRSIERSAIEPAMSRQSPTEASRARWRA
jgi:hypothetical protein